MPKPKSHARLSRIMTTLRPGDVITNLNCLAHRNHQVLVLASRGGNWYDFSVKTIGELKIIRDVQGPWRWDDQLETFVNKEGKHYGQISQEAMVQEGAGMEQVQWYRQLPAPEADRWFINPHHMIGTAGEPGTLAKMEAILARSRDADPNQEVRNISHAIELIFDGTGLDVRRMRLLQVLINSLVAMNIEAHQRRPSQSVHPLADLMASMDDIFGDEGDDTSWEHPLGQMLRRAAEAAAGRHEHRQTAEGGGQGQQRRPSSPGARPNGADSRHHG